ncbi:MAG: polyprenyl synthetase family protein [Chroococcidiopsidaceae cyanobacterium CP_BM_RX_35]|nr:polyprenyl synthetase family protein [Chroococcidiopsidaceae cyanobacterium CP_BM_RX_35]
MLHRSLITSYEQWLIKSSKAVLQYISEYSARMAATPRQREAFEKAIRLSSANRKLGKFFPPVHLPLLVYSGVHGVDEPAIPVSGANLLISIGADLYDNLNDGDLPEDWKAYPDFEIIFTADGIACILPQSIVAALDISTDRRQHAQELLAKCLLQMFAGQAQDLTLNHAINPSVETVEASVLAKSGLQGALYTGLAACTTDASKEVIEAYTAFGCNLGMILQLRSDAHELFYDPECRDLVNSTRTLQIALCLEQLSGSERTDFLTLLDRARTDVAAQQQVRAKLREIRFMYPWMAIVQKYLARAEAALEIAAPQEPVRSILYALLSVEVLKKFGKYLESRIAWT